MSNTHNVLTLDVDGEMAEGSSYATVSQLAGKRLNKQAEALITELGIDLPALVEFEGFAESDADGITDMLERGGMFSEFDEVEDTAPDGYDSLSDWEQHGILSVDDRASRERVRVNPEDYRTGGNEFAYVGDGAQGHGTYTTVADRERARKATAKRAAAPQQTTADMYRQAHKLGLELSIAKRRRFERKFAKHERTLANLDAFLKDAK